MSKNCLGSCRYESKSRVNRNLVCKGDFSTVNFPRLQVLKKFVERHSHGCAGDRAAPSAPLPWLLAPVTAGSACGYTSTAGQDHSLCSHRAGLGLFCSLKKGEKVGGWRGGVKRWHCCFPVLGLRKRVSSFAEIRV